MAKEVGSDQSKTVSGAPSIEVDYVALLNTNIANSKQKLTEQFSQIRQLLDENETAIMKQINEIHQQRQEAVGSLQEMRSHSIALQKLMSKNVNPIQLGTGNIEDSILQITDQLIALTEVEDKWNLDKVKELLLGVNAQTRTDTIVAPETELKQTAEFEFVDNISKGNETQLGHLSNTLGGMVADTETGSIFIADTGNNCIQVYGRTGTYLLTITHELLVAPSSVALSGKYLYSCNNKLGECHKNDYIPCNCRQGYTCKFYNQFLLKFSKRDGQMISFFNINASFGLISATNQSLYLYSCGYTTDFTHATNELSISPNANANERIVGYDEVFQTDKTLSLFTGVLPGTGCLNCSPHTIPVIAVQAFEDEFHLLCRNGQIKSFNLKTGLRREINVTSMVPRTLSYFCWDREINGNLLLTDTQNKQVVVVSQLGRFHSAVEVKNKDNELISPAAISRGSNAYYTISSNGEDNWMIHVLKLV